MKKRSLVNQILNRLLPMVKAGVRRNKIQDKADGVTHKYIYSWETFRYYLKHSSEAMKWVKKKYDCKTLEEGKKHIPEYLKTRMACCISPYTIGLEASALAKVYGCGKSDWGVDLPRGTRSVTIRSRGERDYSKVFCEKKNIDIVEFCKGTGLRRHELMALTPEQISSDGLSVEDYKGKVD